MFNELLRSVESNGEYERLTEGCFENCLSMRWVCLATTRPSTRFCPSTIQTALVVQ
eukprot:m.255564 g.255564  ORF g.255564 m.255564 type:complete len:56 (+) comp11011_c0_seq38:1642-1809(+)